jgi:DNA polymerase-4
MDRIIFLIDMNAYFASVEQVVNPALRGKPVIVCGEGRTVVTTASYEARAFGIKTGMALFEAKHLCPSVINVPGDMNRYVDTSQRIQKTLLEFTPQMEAYSIDECFMDVTDLCKNGTTPKDVGRDVKRRIKEETGLLCSVGIGPNRMIAKLASKMQKPDGLVEVRAEDIPALFAHRPIEELQGIGVGRKLSAHLRSLGITTAGQLGAASISMLHAHFGILGYHLKRMGQGLDDTPVDTYWAHEGIKSFGHSHTLPRNTWDKDVVKSYLLMLSEKVGTRLRAAGMMGRCVTLTVRYGDFTTFSRQCSLKGYIKTGAEIYTTAYKTFCSLLPLEKAVRLLGVTISSLGMDEKQGFLLDDIERQEKLTGIVDEINEKYGEFTLKPSSLLIAEKFGIYKSCGMVARERIKKRMAKE